MTNLSRKEIVSLDKQHIWHPYTQMKEYVEELNPLVIEKTEGVFLYDKNKKRYYDGNSSWWVNNLGHSNPRLINTLKKQIDTLSHCSLAGTTHEPAAVAAKALCDVVSDGLNKVFFSDDGSTAVEVALKMAFQYWKQNGKDSKKRFVTFQNAFHGETIGAVSVSGIDVFHKTFSSLLFDAVKVTSPHCYRCPVGNVSGGCNVECFAEMEKVLMEQKNQIAAVIVEPLVQGAAGMLIYPEEYLRRLRSLTKEIDTFLIIDEVFTGFGRTGKMFACEHADISPDFICLSKGITGGVLPFAATLTTDRLYAGFYDDYSTQRTFYYGHSYCGNPLGAALASEVLNIFREESIIDSMQPKIVKFKKLLEKFKDLDAVGDVRSIGLIGAIEIVADKKTKVAFPAEKRFGKLFYEKALSLGAYLRPLGDVIYMVPPLTITEQELEELVNITYHSIEFINSLLRN